MPLVGSVPSRLLTVMFGTWKAKENQVEGTYSRDTRGHGDYVDLDTVVDKVSTSMRVVRESSGSVFMRIKGLKRRVEVGSAIILPAPNEKRDIVPFRRVSQ